MRSVNNTSEAEEELTITEFSTSVDPDVFALSNISVLPAGTYVSWAMSRTRPVESGNLEFDGERIVATVGTPIRRSWNTGLIAINVAAILSIMAIIVFRKHISTRRGARPN